MKNTPNYNLNKPDGNDYAKIESLNENADIIDEELKRISIAIGNGSTGNDILSRLDTLETRVGNLNNLETTQKANLVAAINEVRKSAINAWQKGVYNDTTITNLGPDNAVRTFNISPSDWKSAVNVEQLAVYLPINGAFSGIIKATYNSTWGNLEAWGGVEVVYEIGSFLSSGLKLNRATITTASEQFTKSYKVLPATVDNTTGHIALILLKAPRASNPFKIKVEMQGFFHTSQTVFDVLKNTTIHIDDLGSSTYGGYPWTPQTSSFVQHSTGNNYILGGAMTLGGNFSISKGVPLIEMSVPSSTTNASAQFLLNASTTQDFGLEFRKNNVAYMVAHGQKQVAFLGHDEVWFTIQDLKQSASDVKKNVAQAITDKGVPTSPDATGAQMATNIRAIKTGKKTDRGTINIPALAAGATTSVNMVVYFKPSTVVLNLDGRYMVDGQLHGNDWANRHSVYDIRVVPFDSTNWMVTFFIRGGQFGASQQYNYALFIE